MVGVDSDKRAGDIVKGKNWIKRFEKKNKDKEELWGKDERGQMTGGEEMRNEEWQAGKESEHMASV